MHTSLRSECARHEAYTLPWSETTSEQVLVLFRLRTKGYLTKIAGNPWDRESRASQRLEPFHATVCTQALDQSARNPRLVYCLGLNHFRNRGYTCLACTPRANPLGEMTEMFDNHGSVKGLRFNDLSLPTPPYARKPPIRVRKARGLYIALN